MKLKIACDSCYHEFAVSDQLLGKRVKCPSCGAPATNSAPPPAQPTVATTAAPPTSQQQPAIDKSAVIEARGKFKGFPNFQKPGPHMQFQFDAYTGTTPMKEAIERIVKDYSAADFDSLQIDVPTHRFRFQFEGAPETTSIATALVQSGFQGLSISKPQINAK